MPDAEFQPALPKCGQYLRGSARLFLGSEEIVSKHSTGDSQRLPAERIRQNWVGGTACGPIDYNIAANRRRIQVSGKGGFADPINNQLHYLAVLQPFGLLHHVSLC